MKENKVLDLIDDEELKLIVGGCSNSSYNYKYYNPGNDSSPWVAPSYGYGIGF